MSFSAPWALLALVVVIPVYVIGTRSEGARARALSVLGARVTQSAGSAAPAARARRWGQRLALAALALIVVGVARPLAGPGARAVGAAGRDVLFVLDLSRSMSVTDVAPSRLEAAKRAAMTIARALPDDRVGLVVFGGSAFLQLPPTVDHSTFRLFLDAASPSDIPDPGTNLEAASGLVAATLSHSDAAGYAAAVVLSDGEDGEGKLEEAIQTLAGAHVPTFAVGVGTVAGTLLTERDSTGAPKAHLDWAGREVTTRLVEQNLADIAARTGGRYVHWHGDGSVGPIISGLSRLPGRRVEGRARAGLAERFQWPLAAALGALLAEAMLVRRRGPA